MSSADVAERIDDPFIGQDAVRRDQFFNNKIEAAHACPPTSTCSGSKPRDTTADLRYGMPALIWRFRMLRRSAMILSIAAALPLAATASAAEYPDRPIRVIVSVPAGGGVDTVTRIVTDKMRAALGQPLVVENKPGVSGSLAAETVVMAEPDGYTLLASQPAPITTAPFLYKSLNYNPAQLIPVAVMSHVPNVVLVRQD